MKQKTLSADSFRMRQAKVIAEHELRERWTEAAERNSKFAADVSLSLYLQRNLSAHTTNVLTRQ